ncbi:hypothetical protein PSSHI_06300 [Photobacterium sp. R1]
MYRTTGINRVVAIVMAMAAMTSNPTERAMAGVANKEPVAATAVIARIKVSEAPSMYAVAAVKIESKAA